MITFKDTNNKIFRLTGIEGCLFTEMEVQDKYSTYFNNIPKNLNLYVKVVGFEDLKAPNRNWGWRSFDDYKEPIKKIIVDRKVTIIKYKKVKCKLPHGLVEVFLDKIRHFKI
jgi:hypothetical protein